MTTQMAELAHQLQTEHKRLEAAHDSLRAAVEALHQIAEVERLSAAVATAERLREEDRMNLIRCKSAMREWQVASEFADDRAVKANKEVERLQAQLEALVGLVERWPELDCASWCSDLRCNCGAEDQNLTRAAARRAVGLEG